MIPLRPLTASLALAAATFALAGCATVSAPAVPVAKADPARISAAIRTLASDEFAGRAPGTAGEAKTIAWLAQEFEALGLEPGGPNRSWTTEVPLLHTRVDTTAPLTVAGRGGPIVLTQGTDVYVSTQSDTPLARIASAPLVFVGYGVKAPEKQWDDFKGADLKGKVAVFLVNDPDFGLPAGAANAGLFGGQAMTYYGRWTYKFEEAVRQGAVAALIVHDTPGAGYGWNTVTAPGGENYDLANGADGRVALQGWLSGAAAQRLFSASGLDFAAQAQAARGRDFRPVPLGDLRLSAAVPVKRERVMSHNVLAMIPGTSARGEFVTYGAHWDAYGEGAPDAQGRTVRPGALDDGSGIAALLEVARMFKAAPPPRRSVLFGIWTAEERGLLGSEAFAASGLYPIKSMVANITLDTLQPNGPARDFVQIGHGQSSLDGDLARAAAAQGRTVTPDARPERGLFYRADHFSFARRGVPSLMMMALGGGVDLMHGGRAAGDKWVSDFTAQCYHQTCDAWSAGWDFTGMAQDADLVYAIGARIANGTQWPRWNPASEFAAKR